MMAGKSHRRLVLQALALSFVSLYDAKRFTMAFSPLGTTRFITQIKASKGMAKSPPSKKKKGVKVKATPFNVGASLLRLEKQYDAITRAATKALNEDDDEEGNNEDQKVFSEYVVAVRAPGYVADWVPVAQLCLERTTRQMGDGGVADPILDAAVSLYCRELSHVASMGCRVFQSVPRNIVQYSIETDDSFNKHVYKPVGGGATSSDVSMTKTEAREILGVQETGDKEQDRRLAKTAYRKNSFKYHPDRVVGEPDAVIDEAASEYHRIQQAYEALTSGVRGSWYESLGGRARTDFRGPITLMSQADATNAMKPVKGAVMGLSPDLVQMFAARSQHTVMQ